MAELFDMKELEERVILVAVSTSDEDDTEASLDELEELADTAGATAIGRLVQNREKIHPGTYLGSGKIGELREMVWEMGATGVICDDELSPAQLRNLESALDTKVMDRTMVILDIFAAHATTSEGKIQVELALSSIFPFVSMVIILSRYFREMPCLVAISLTGMNSPELCCARSTITRSAYLLFADIIISFYHLVS